MAPEHEHQTIFEDVLDLVVDGLADPVEIGRGGGSVVYRVRQPAFGRDAALKVVDAFVLDDDAKLRYERECLALGSLAGHPNIVTLYDAALTTSWRPYIVMELLGGGSLADRLAADGPMPWREAIDAAVKIADALGAAHDRGVLHRDLKPGNVLVSDYGVVKLADFGIARVEGVEHTRTGGNVVASIAHAAPEVLGGGQPTQAADVYALGSMVCELLVGHPPFRDPDDESFLPMIERIQAEELPSFIEVGLPPPVQAVLARAMDKDPARRFAAAGAFRAALVNALEELVVAPAPPASPPPRPDDGIEDPLQDFLVPRPGQRPGAWDAHPTPTTSPGGGDPIAAPGASGSQPDGAVGPSAWDAVSPADRTTAWGSRPPRAPEEPAPPRDRRRLLLVVGAVVTIVVLAVGGVLGVGLLRGDGPVRPLTNAELERSLLAVADAPGDVGDPVPPGSPLQAVPVGTELCPGDGLDRPSPRARASRLFTAGELSPYLAQQLVAFPDRDTAVSFLESVNAAGLRCERFTRDEPAPASIDVTTAPAPQAPDDVGVVAFDLVVTDEIDGIARPARLVVVQLDEYVAVVELSVATARSTPPALDEVLRATERSLRALP